MSLSVMRCTLLVVGLFFLSGCAVKKNIPLSENFWQEKPKIVIAHYKAPEPDMIVPSSQGLVDIAITRMANDKIITRLKQADLTWYQNLPHELAEQLTKRSIKVVIDPIPVVDEKSIIARARGDKILVIRLKAVGIRREYAVGFIPSGAPQAYCLVSGELIDPSNQKIPLWRSEIEIVQPIRGPWDEPPHFANFMESLNKATDAAGTELAYSLITSH
jgi:hypothetical protein